MNGYLLQSELKKSSIIVVDKRQSVNLKMTHVKRNGFIHKFALNVVIA